MAIDEAARHELYSRLDELLGPDPTSTLMSLLPPVGWADVATKQDLRIIELRMDAGLADVRTEIADLRTELRTGLGDVRSDVRRELHEGLADARADRASIRVELHDALRKQTITLVGTMLSISGLTFAATALLS